MFLGGRFEIKLFEAVATRDGQMTRGSRAIDLAQLASRGLLDVGRQLAAALAIPDAFGFLVGAIWAR